jgi:2-iminoacetate synthase ThiH
VDENISRAAGAEHGQMMTESQMRTLVEPLCRSLEQRTTLYDRVQGGTKLHVTTRNDGRILIPVTSA